MSFGASLFKYGLQKNEEGNYVYVLKDPVNILIVSLNPSEKKFFLNVYVKEYPPPPQTTLGGGDALEARDRSMTDR